MNLQVGFRVWGWGFRAFRAWGELGVREYSIGFRVRGLGPLGFRVGRE